MDTASLLAMAEEATVSTTPIVIPDEKPTTTSRSTSSKGGMALGRKGGKEVSPIPCVHAKVAPSLYLINGVSHPQ